MPTLILGVKPALVIGTDLLYSVPAKIFASFLHQRQGTIGWTITRMLLVGGVPGAIGGLVLFAVLKAHSPIDALETALKHAIGVAILLPIADKLLLPAVAMRRLIGSEIAFAAFLVPLAAAGRLSFRHARSAMAGSLLRGFVALRLDRREPFQSPRRRVVPGDYCRRASVRGIAPPLTNGWFILLSPAARGNCCGKSD